MKQISKEEIYLNELNGLNDWDDLSLDYDLSEDVIEEFADKLNWDLICINKKVNKFTNNLSVTIAHLLRSGEVMVTVVVHHSP